MKWEEKDSPDQTSPEVFRSSNLLQHRLVFCGTEKEGQHKRSTRILCSFSGAFEVELSMTAGISNLQQTFERIL